MPHVSKRKLEKKTFFAMQERFFEHVLALRQSANDRRLLEELFTHTERIMLAKRFSIVFMLEEGFSTRAIERLLKVSPSTIARISLKRSRGDFLYMVNFLRKRKRREQMWKELEQLSRGGLPPMGRGRWRSLYSEKQK